MKRSLSLLLASLMLVFALTACGRSNNTAQDTDRNDHQSESAVIGGDSAANGNNGGSSSGNNDRPGNNGAAGDPNGNGSLLDDMGNAVEDGLNGMENAVDDITGDTARSRTNGTVSR